MARDEEFDQIKKDAKNKKMEGRKHKIKDLLFQKRRLYAN